LNFGGRVFGFAPRYLSRWAASLELMRRYNLQKFSRAVAAGTSAATIKTKPFCFYTHLKKIGEYYET